MAAPALLYVVNYAGLNTTILVGSCRNEDSVAGYKYSDNLIMICIHIICCSSMCSVS